MFSPIPKPVLKLITLTYGTDAESAKELAALRGWKKPER